MRLDADGRFRHFPSSGSERCQWGFEPWETQRQVKPNATPYGLYFVSCRSSVLCSHAVRWKTIIGE